MTTWLNFNLFGNVSHTKQTNQSRILDPKIIYYVALCDNKMSWYHFLLTKQPQLRWWRNSRYCLSRMLISSVSMIKLKKWGKRKSRRTLHTGTLHTGYQHFTYWYLLSFLGARNVIYCFLCWETVVFWYIHFYSGVSTKCLFESILLFWKYLNKL